MTFKKMGWEQLPAVELQRRPHLAADWNRLNDLRGGLPFLTASAIASAVEVLGDGKEILFVARIGNVVSAMLVMVRDEMLRWRTFQPSQLPLGAWVADPDLHLPELVDSFANGVSGVYLAISITQIDPQLGEAPLNSERFVSREYIETAWVDIDQEFEQYWNQRGKNLRQNMRKQRNKLLSDGIDAHMRILTEAADVGAAIERYGALESSGWKAHGGTSIHPDNAQGRFYRRLFEEASGRGEAFVYEYLFGDRTVAMSLCLLRSRTLVMLKTTYDESIKTYSPAFLLNQNLLQDLFNQGQVKRLEYFGRVMEWHTRWTSNKRELFHLTRYRWPLIKLLADKRHERRMVGTPAAAAVDQ